MPLGIAAVLRLTLVVALLGSTLAGDEVAYQHLGSGWSTFGEYTGQWGPGYPAMIALVTTLFGEAAVTATRFIQVGLALWIGVWVAATAAMFGGRRAGLAAAWIYAIYLPLASFSALLYSETLFLSAFVPGLYQLLRSAREGRLDMAWWRLPLAGMLLGTAALVRESTVLFAIPSMIWIAFALRGHPAVKTTGRFRLRLWAHGSGPVAIGPAGIFALSFMIAILPWSARNATVYDRFVPVATTAGGNALIGWNAHDLNFDLAGLGVANSHSRTGMSTPGELRAKIRGAAPEGWTRRTVHNRADQMRANIGDGLAFAAQNPAFFVRSRVVEFIDLVSPISFMVRQFRTAEGIGEPLNDSMMRRIYALLSVLLAPLLAILALSGWATARDAAPLRSLSAMIVLCTSGVTLVSGLSRFRIPMVPILIVLAAVYISGAKEKPPAKRRAIASCVAIGLILAWIPSLRPVQLSLSAIW